MADSFSSERLDLSALSSGAPRGAVFMRGCGQDRLFSRDLNPEAVPAILLPASGADTISCGEQKRNDARITSRRRRLRIGRGGAARFSFSLFGESSTNFVKNFPGFPESWIRNPLICLAMGQRGSRRVGGPDARNPCQIQHVVQRSVLKSICSREHTVNRNESAIRRRFVPWLFLSAMAPTTTGGAMS